MFRDFIQLIKPGIIFGNLVAVLGGYFLAGSREVSFLLLFVLLGISLVIASACVFNNFIDKDIDAKMQRTRSRILVTKRIPNFIVISFGLVLGLLGLFILFFYVNPLSALLALIGFFIYVILYTICFKRNSIFGVFVGSFSGAIPLIIGYCSVSNRFDLVAFLLVAIFSSWQMIHSYAIAIYRFDDYKAANISILPVLKGIVKTKNHMIFHLIIFTFLCSLLTLIGATGIWYFFVMLFLNFIWLFLLLRKSTEQKKWARELFIFSILIVIFFSFMISFDSQLRF